MMRSSCHVAWFVLAVGLLLLLISPVSTWAFVAPSSTPAAAAPTATSAAFFRPHTALSAVEGLSMSNHAIALVSTMMTAASAGGGDDGSSVTLANEQFLVLALIAGIFLLFQKGQKRASRASKSKPSSTRIGRRSAKSYPSSNKYDSFGSSSSGGDIGSGIGFWYSFWDSSSYDIGSDDSSSSSSYGDCSSGSDCGGD